MKVVFDTETNGLDNPDKMWLFGGINVDTKERYKFEPFRGGRELEESIKWAESVSAWIGHRAIQFDAQQINRLIKPKLIDPTKVIDTLIVSRLVDYSIPIPKGGSSPHSLDSWGIRLGLHKGNFTNFEEYSEEMVEYWERDLDVTEALFEHFKPIIYDEKWKKSLRVEHDIQIELERQKYYGFHFDKPKAEELLSSIQVKMETLEAKIKEDFPPKLELVKTLKYGTKKNGDEYERIVTARASYPMTKLSGEDFECYDYVEFNPGSPKDRIDVLWDCGWKPYDKTKTYKTFDRLRVGDYYSKSIPVLTKEIYDKKKEEFERYGWTCSEDNLETLPMSAPEGARSLAQWLTLEGRRSSLVEWIGQVKDDGRIHGSVEGIGAWTGRCSHNNPNTANIAAPFKGEVRNTVEEIKLEYDGQLRALWDVPKGSWLVGVDAEGIQLRILGDQIWRHIGEREYSDTIVSGNKEEGTDIHNVNKRALGLNHISRDDSKTFIYAWILNAGVPKVASILHTTVPIAASARNNFESSIKGLKQFKGEVLPQIAKQGHFTGYDGRLVKVPNLHKVLAGILQNGEAVVLKHSRMLWTKELKGGMIPFKPVGFIHDEFCTQVEGTREDAERVKEVQIASIIKAGLELGFLTPLAGSGDVGKSWLEVH